MGADWMKDVREKSRKKRRMLFSRDSACLQGLLEPHGPAKTQDAGSLGLPLCGEAPQHSAGRGIRRRSAPIGRWNCASSGRRGRSKCPWPRAPCFRCMGWPER